MTAVAVSAGSDHTCAIAPGGVLYCWGKNLSGELGDSTTTQRERPVRVTGGLRLATVRVGYDNTCGVTVDGTAYCWGGNLDGRLGDSTDTSRTRPVLGRGRLTFVTVSSAFFRTCGLTKIGRASWRERVEDSGDAVS